MRDYLVLGFVFASLPFCFFRPFFGVLVFSWLGYMNPHRLSWGIAYSFPVAKWVAAVTLAGALISGDRKPIPFKRETVLLLVLVVLFTVSSVFSFYPGRAWEQWNQLLKMLVITFLTMAFFVDTVRLRWLLMTISLSVGFFGIKGAVFSVWTGGNFRIFGPPGTFLEDNNDLALALVMICPLFLYLALHESKPWLRRLMWFSLVCCLMSVVFTYSRGGFVALSAVVGLFSLQTRYKFQAAVVLTLAVVLAFAFVPGAWFERIATIGDVEGYEEEGSIQGRLNAWGFAWNLALDHPLTGGGFGCFTKELFLDYAPDPLDYHDAHSIYFEVLAEHGFPGLFVFGLLMLSIFGTLWRLRREYMDHPQAEWISSLASMLMLSFTGYLAGGAFLGRAYFDLTYQLVAIVVVLRALAEQAPASATVPAQAPSGAGRPARAAMAPAGPAMRAARPRRG